MKRAKERGKRKEERQEEKSYVGFGVLKVYKWKLVSFIATCYLVLRL